MTAADTIARLDAALLREGETVTITRGATSVTTRASVRGVKAEDLIGSATTSEYMVVVSPTGLSSLGLPRKTDKVVAQGRGLQVMMVDNIHVNGTWVRSNLVVAG